MHRVFVALLIAYFCISHADAWNCKPLALGRQLLQKPRAAVAAVGVIAALTGGQTVALAEEPSATISGVVSLSEGQSPPSDNSASALYITAKEDLNLWTTGVRNIKAPPVLTKRIPGPVKFPVEFTLDYSNDATPEGQVTFGTWADKKALLLSARWDDDGVAATRSQDDLVGKAVADPLSKGQWGKVNIEMTDRGVGGKLVTKKK
jgi:hypothetical protein